MAIGILSSLGTVRVSPRYLRVTVGPSGRVPKLDSAVTQKVPFPRPQMLMRFYFARLMVVSFLSGWDL